MTVLVTIAVYRIPPDLLERAVRSVLGQTYTDLQLLVLGDGEPVTLDVQDDRLEVHDLPANRGPYFCQAVAIAASPHEWYATVGADDWIEPDHLETMLATGGSSVAPAYWNGDRLVLAWAGEFGVTRTERLREIGGYNPAERIAQDTLTMRLLASHGGVSRTSKPTYHYVRRPGSLTTSPDTGEESPARRAVHSRNQAVLAACRGKPVAWIRAFRAGLVPPDIAAEVADHAERLRRVLGEKVVA